MDGGVDVLRHFEKIIHVWDLALEVIFTLRLIIWNSFKWILFNHIEKWNLVEILKLVLPCEGKSSALEKMEYEQILFSKNWAPRIWGGGRVASVCKNNVIFGNFVYYSEKKMFFKISHLQKKRQKVPLRYKNCPRN